MAFDNDPTEAIEIALKLSYSQDEDEDDDDDDDKDSITDKAFRTSQVMIFSTATSQDVSGDSAILESPISSKFPADDKNTQKIDFLQDRPQNQTLGRRIAMHLSETYAWYNPQLSSVFDSDGEEEQNKGETKAKPSLAKAWAFFEHVTLNRYVVSSDHLPNGNGRDSSVVHKALFKCFRGERSLDIAEPGENEVPTKLYSPVHTPMSQLGDFGLGYGLYFATLRGFAILSLLAGLINIPNLLYFSSDEYSQGQTDVTTLLRGSAICTDRTWVACPTCEMEDFDSVGAYPVTRFLEGPFVPAGDQTGTYLNVTKYIQPDLDTFDYIYTDESLDLLYEDFKIRFSDDSINLEGWGELFCEDFQTCLDFYVICDGLASCYLWLGDVYPKMPTFGDIRPIGFALRTNCDGATNEQGFVNLLSIIFFIAGTFVIRYRQKNLEERFDEDEQTAQDYSIQITNPPHDAHSPSEWKDFFERNFDCHVTVCTVDVANDDILQHLIERRNIRKQLELTLPEGTPLDLASLEEEAQKTLESTHWCCRRFFTPAMPKLVWQLKKVTDELQELLKKEADLPVTNVFVTFETEKAQREVLSKLTVGKNAVNKNDIDAVPNPNYLFRGCLVLGVQEPEEPSSIRWQELNGESQRLVGRLVFTSSLTIVAIVIGFAIVMLFYSLQLPFVAGLVTTILTTIFPMLAKAMTGYEIHRSETSRQKWMFIKIALFNIALTAILISLVTPFVATLDNKEGSVPGLIPAVYGLFYFQIFFSPIIQLLDPTGHLDRHVFAPRAKTQEAMNLKMKGSEVFLAERYANMIKFLFLMIWFCALYPAAFFMGSLALFVVYYVDRFSLMRTWARTPQVGSQIAHFGRNYFSPAAVVFMAVVSSYAWSGFPYDNLCEDNTSELNPVYLGDWSIDYVAPDISFDIGGKTITLFDAPNIVANFSVATDSQVYQYCKQDLRFTKGRSFPPLAQFQPEGLEWMTEEQEHILVFFGWLSVAILGGVVLTFLYRMIRSIIRAYKGSYDPTGQDQGIDYSTLRSIDTYIPQSQSDYFSHPLLLCDIGSIDPLLFSWSDPDRLHTYYSISNDIQEFMNPKNVQVSHMFSEVKHWPPASGDGGKASRSFSASSDWEPMATNVFSSKSPSAELASSKTAIGVTPQDVPEQAVSNRGYSRALRDENDAGGDNEEPYDEYEARRSFQGDGPATPSSSSALQSQMTMINEHLATLSNRVERYQAEGMASSLAQIQRDLKKLVEGTNSP